MRFREAFSSPDARYSLGVDEQSGDAYLAISVSNGPVDYDEYYRIDESERDRFLTHPQEATEFAASCRRREQDHRLLQKPGWNRGIPR